MPVKRVYVEKRKGFDVAARELLKDFRENLGESVENVRVIERYDVEGLTDDEFEIAVAQILSDGAADKVYKDTSEFLNDGEEVFAVELLPGQYDQRADSAAQCIQLITREEMPNVRCARIYAISGADDIDKIKKYVVNPVDSTLASLDKYETLKMTFDPPERVEIIDDFTEMDDEMLEQFRTDNGFAMTKEDLLTARQYFKKEGRQPTITELKVLDTYWSDHCRHTTFLTKLDKVSFGGDNISHQAERVFDEYLDARDELDRKKDITLMDIATIYAAQAKAKGELSDFDESEEINACSIKKKVKTDKGDKDYLIMFKNETHNHPTEIEPYGGAATCLGGAIRDPLSGRSYVYHAMRVTGSGDPRESLEDTLEHKLSQRKLTKGAAQGFSSYGNQIGLATGLVDEVYHPGYKAKRLEIGAVVGAAPKENVLRSKPAKDDVIILIGGRTGRDGIGGATGSSKIHDEHSVENCGAEVQKGNPLTERKLQRLFRNPKFTSKVKRCNDFGAGGVCVAIGELADGLDIDLDAVPKKYAGLDGTELAISESQERMAVVVAPYDVTAVLRMAAQENLEAAVVAKVTDTGRMRMNWQGQPVVDISREFLNSNGAPQHARAKVVQNGIKDLLEGETSDTFEQTLKNTLSDLNVCSKKGLQEMFDGTIGAGSVTMPLGGKNQLTPVQTMIAKVPVLDAESMTVTLMSYGFDPYLTEKSPFAGAAYAVLDSVAKVIAAGGALKDCWLTLQEYFERMTEDPEVWGKPLGALLGAYWAQKGLKIAAIGGKDSMSGTFNDIHVPPTLCSFCLATADIKDVITPELKKAGNKLYLLNIDRDEDKLPDFEDVIEKYNKLNSLIKDKTIVSAYAVGKGGYLAGAVKGAFGNGLGVKFASRSKRKMVKKDYGAILVEAASIDDKDFALVGEVLSEPEIIACGETVSLEKALEYYTEPLENVFPTKTSEKGEIKTHLFKERNYKPSVYKTGLPRVVIPVFPGTNCEYDTAAAFKRAGALPQTVVIRNRNTDDIQESVQALMSAINSSQIIMIPGGFSGGDEPDGSAKLIEAIFRNPGVSDAMMNLLKNRDGLMLGICNGFQALIKLGLVPFGELTDAAEGSPTLTFNSIGRHVSCIARTRVTSVNSPWMHLAAVGDVHNVAVSHGEGRFSAGQDLIIKLSKNGQIATQYVDWQDKPSMDIVFNPNGSMWAVEGLFSPDGHVFGKMGHSERAGLNVAVNVPGDYDQKIFESGTAYFR